ncbi:hypothetical protein EV560_11645 [Bosea sp. BK604]|nr:hypothetical protein EV560_11645 [Bosea sp. BK604]
MAERNVVFVLGGSGSGKSSLVKAGLIPSLRAEPITQRVGVWYSLQFRPGEAPSARFVQAFVDDIIAPIIDRAKDVSVKKLCYDALRKTFKLKGVDENDSPEAVLSQCLKAVEQLLYENEPDAKEGRIISIDAVRSIVAKLYTLDTILSGAATAGPPNLLIVLDQFEEVFEDDVGELDRKQMIALVKSIYNDPPASLFLAVTARSEELHRCAEHDGLAKVINGSLYLVDLMGKAELAKAIQGPAKVVLASWGLASRQPFTETALEALLETYRAGDRVLLAADKLPLTQHLLPIVWDRAVQRWSETDPEELQVEASDLQAVPGWADPKLGTLRGCLNAQADRILAEAMASAEKRWQVIRSQPGLRRNEADRRGADTRAASLARREIGSLITVALTLLAKRDDRGNPKRAFASLAEILDASGVAERELDSRKQTSISAEIIEMTLGFFMAAGLIELTPDGAELKYTVVHEAFIRGWNLYQELWKDAQDREEQLIEIDRAVGMRRAPSNLWSPIGLLNWINAENEVWARSIISETAMTGLLANVFGDDRTFSTGWCRALLARSKA